MEHRFTCHKCGKKYNSKFWFDWHLSNHKSIFNKYNIIMVITIPLILMIFFYIYSPYLDFLKVESTISPQRENYISIIDVERLFNPSDNSLDLKIVMKNVGTKITEITNIEVEFVGEEHKKSTEENIILNPDATVSELIIFKNQEIEKPHIIRFRINYTNPLTTKIENYCIEYYLRYSGEPPQYYVLNVNSTIC